MLKVLFLSRLFFGLLFGLLGGLAFYTFYYAKGSAYLLNDPKACANCHIMQDQYSGWLKSSHRNAATCNDCHTPPSMFGKYFSKASNGFWHSFAFTTGWFYEPIQIKPHNRKITETSCHTCHSDMTQNLLGSHLKTHFRQEIKFCTTCHSSVGHMK